MQNRRFDTVQRFGRTLMLPIAVLPIAGLLLRLGQPDVLGWPFMAQAGDAIFANLALLFAIGIALGFAKENHGAAALAGAIGYFVLTAGAKTINDKINMGVLGGIIAGLMAGWLYNKYRDIKLPEALAFFAGKRFVPIVTGFACLVLAFVFGYVWPYVQMGIDAIGHWAVVAGGFGLFVYGFLNRLLIPLGLHHIINSLAWFVLGDFTGPKGLVHGDLNRFYAGDPTAGGFMAGFFPVMMFGLPAACLAMYKMAKPENRKRVGGLLLSAAAVSFVTGITEPIEFAFMFLAPVLYGIHAVLTGVSLAVCNALGVKIGFTFSGGAIDFVLSKGISTNWWYAVVIGLAYFAIYYVVFVAAIRMWNLQTMGREEVSGEGETVVPATAIGGIPAAVRERVNGYILALGGQANILSLDACATRLRVSVKNGTLVQESQLKAIGARGVIRPSEGSLQVVVGPTADALADEINAALKAMPRVNA